MANTFDTLNDSIKQAIKAVPGGVLVLLELRKRRKANQRKRDVLVIEQLRDEAKKLRDNENWGRPF